ncbi:helix-turn-helix transcriptional regulator [Rahnella bonaserana]|jgi:DNA-binding CsgD family transcriptional regulator
MADGYVNDPASGSQSLSHEQIRAWHMLWGMSSEPWCVKDSDGLLFYANDAYLDILDIPTGTPVFGKSDEDLMISARSNVVAAIVSGNKYSLSESVFDKANFILKVSQRCSGETTYLYFDKHPIFRPNEGVCGFCLHGRREFIFSLNMFSKGNFAVKIKGNCPAEIFTERQWEVIYFLQQHYTNAEIADILSISPKTINNHVSQIYKRVGVTGSSEFIVFCQKCDLLNYIPERLQDRMLM